jgi:hypothetical protein
MDVILGLVVVVLLFWIWSHSWLMRPLIRRLERAFHFRYPFIDVIWPR